MFQKSRSRSTTWYGVVAACLLLGVLHAAQAATLYFPSPETADDERGNYSLNLLRLVLKKAGSRDTVERNPLNMLQNRSVLELAMGNGKLDVIAGVTTKEREEKLLPIRIPITKGLVGWRLLLIKAGQRERLRDVRTLHDLLPFRVAQGHDWPDTVILRDNGLLVSTVAHYNSLFTMLNLDRLDYVPRSLPEIWAELDHYRGLDIDPYLVLHYRSADYFFVNRKNTKLAETIRRGLEIAMEDGTFDKLFYEHYGKLIKDANLEKRHVIELVNPLLPVETPVTRKELWFSLDDLKRIK
ncbi:transporter substrate-binding domain-containing protein [Janthinobacterium agaricidamnosum]|uniref:Uncharacterized protein n=1 Tax=Janthinobacterium agaricidamnosum NBRC 102515 = DSM 9628 TaxID=1349767 RepID=W0V0I5_9BURK|nr:transporter substrate-binding domain-containing protein [Janthinobacterium agaricidamnosum]CDG80797.1 putative uncharacterized protein [Janthinobacterium agaricidamnosum NBRC 102515 = DSM 9628]